MKKIFLLLTFFYITIASVYAQNPPLQIAASRFVPPYVMQGANNLLFGFDVAMMDFICKQIQRDCHYQVMSFNELLPAIVNKKADVAIGAIAITAERAQIVNFSSPYLPSYARFLAPANLKGKQFNLSLLKNKSIGVEAGTVFADLIKLIGVETPRIVTYKYENTMIADLTAGTIDFALLDAPTALYWQNHSSGLLLAIGIPLPYGYGLGIAVNKEEPLLLQAINQVLHEYQKSAEFIKNYRMYLEEF